MFDWEYDIALHAIQVNRPSSPAKGTYHVISQLRQEPGVYSRVTAGMAIRNSTLFTKVSTLV